MSDTTLGGVRNYISGFEGSQAVPACSSGIDNAYDRIFFIWRWKGFIIITFELTLGGLYSGEILTLPMGGLHVKHAVQRGIWV
jgi:hypothetical protein